MRHNLPAAADKYYYAAGVAGLDLSQKSREEGALLAADWVDQLRRRFTPYGCLKDAGLGVEDIPRMVEIALKIRRLLDPNPVFGERRSGRGDVPNGPGLEDDNVCSSMPIPTSSPKSAAW